MKRFWDFAEENPLIVLLIVAAVLGAIVKITTGQNFDFF